MNSSVLFPLTLSGRFLKHTHVFERGARTLACRVETLSTPYSFAHHSSAQFRIQGLSRISRLNPIRRPTPRLPAVNQRASPCDARS